MRCDMIHLFSARFHSTGILVGHTVSMRSLWWVWKHRQAPGELSNQIDRQDVVFSSVLKALH